MIFNFWRPYPFLKPKRDGWYLCTVGDQVTRLYYNEREDRWVNVSRQQVFDGYKVYKTGREPLEYNRVYTDRLCEPDDILAWKRLPKSSRLFWRWWNRFFE